MADAERQTIIRVVSQRAEVCDQCGGLNLFRLRCGPRKISDRTWQAWARCKHCGRLAKVVFEFR